MKKIAVAAMVSMMLMSGTVYGQENELDAFDEITVVDNEACMIKITGLDPENMWGYTVNTYLENKSQDKKYMYAVSKAAVNGLQTDPFFAAEVAAGKKSNENICFMDAELEENGIEDYTDIELSFRVYDAEDWAAPAVAEETVHVYPGGEENAERFVRESQPEDQVILDNDAFSVIVTGYEEDEIWGYTVQMYLVNKTEKELTVAAEDVSVNGFMADPFWAASVSGGKAKFVSMSWMDTTFEDNNIDEVEEIELTLRLYDMNDWMAEDLANEKVILNP